MGVWVNPHHPHPPPPTPKEILRKEPSKRVYTTEEKWHGSDKKWNGSIHFCKETELLQGAFTRQSKNGTGPTKNWSIWTRRRTDKSSLFLCKNCWNRSSFCRASAIFALSCKCPYIVSSQK